MTVQRVGSRIARKRDGNVTGEGGRGHVQVDHLRVSSSSQ